MHILRIFSFYSFTPSIEILSLHSISIFEFFVLLLHLLIKQDFIKTLNSEKNPWYFLRRHLEWGCNARHWHSLDDFSMDTTDFAESVYAIHLSVRSVRWTTSSVRQLTFSSQQHDILWQAAILENMDQSQYYHWACDFRIRIHEFRGQWSATKYKHFTT